MTFGCPILLPFTNSLCLSHFGATTDTWPVMVMAIPSSLAAKDRRNLASLMLVEVSLMESEMREDSMIRHSRKVSIPSYDRARLQLESCFHSFAAFVASDYNIPTIFSSDVGMTEGWKTLGVRLPGNLRTELVRAFPKRPSEMIFLRRTGRWEHPCIIHCYSVGR
ncbi:hypothetical protein L218DRAFT_309777 [Marasmius fiardii PR-910]|nr:hypothetical protein L218DRAFT_309777 [Marasmius fiardii PR-910]